MARKSKDKKICKSDIALIFVAVTLVAFVLKMIRLYETTGGVPEALVYGVLGILGFECGCLGKIYENKQKYKEREWQKEDEKEAEKKAKSASGRRKSE